MLQEFNSTEIANAEHSTLHTSYKTTGWKITSSIHARSQSHIRHSNKSNEDWQVFHRNIVHGINKSISKDNGAHLIYSNSHDHGVVAHVNHKKREVHIITVLPKGRSHTTHEGDNKIMVESLESFSEFVNANKL